VVVELVQKSLARPSWDTNLPDMGLSTNGCRIVSLKLVSLSSASPKSPKCRCLSAFSLHESQLACISLLGFVSRLMNELGCAGLATNNLLDGIVSRSMNS